MHTTTKPTKNHENASAKPHQYRIEPPPGARYGIMAFVVKKIGQAKKLGRPKKIDPLAPEKPQPTPAYWV